jgi:hypothetical protein
LYISQYYSEFLDFAINLDGYNECLPFPKPLSYPYYYASTFLPLKFSSKIYLKIYLAEKITKLQSTILFSKSSILEYLLARFRKDLNSEVGEMISSLDDSELKGKTKNQIGIYLANKWKKNTLLQGAALSGAGVRFYAFFQPNQHFKGSKPLSQKEKNEFINPSFKDFVQPCYEEAGRSIDQLKAKGLAVGDLRYAFKEIKEDLYVDQVTHVNDLARSLMFESMLTLIEKTN